jgi:DNA-binding NtrC family response regulator
MSSDPNDQAPTVEKSKRSKFPDFVPPTKIAYADRRGPTLHLRRCTLTLLGPDGKPTGEVAFDKEEVSLGAMADNDVVVNDDTASRYHCKIVQEDTGYVLVDLRSTNGTFVNKVRIREAFLKPGSVIGVGQSQIKFNAKEEQVTIQPSDNDRCGDIIGRNSQMRQLYGILEKIAPTATTVVIEGETGTGKEVVAQSIHKLSPRKDGPIIIFDCGAVPPNLIESELFGHEKGSFTGAVMTRQGLFEMADGGTLFLDELGELPLDLQPKLLRALEQREVRRVGAAKSTKVDVRIIAATNRNLEEEVRAGNFRQDLFYRLSVVRLRLPALRERTDDIPLLINHFLESQRYNKKPDGSRRASGISPAGLACLQSYSWPGNVRELVNVVERAVSFCDSGVIEPVDLPEHIRDSRGMPAPPYQPPVPVTEASVGSGVSLSSEPPRPPAELVSGEITFKDAKEKWVSAFERDYIVSLLKRHNGNISHAAREADIDRKYFRKLMKKYDIDAADARE